MLVAQVVGQNPYQDMIKISSQPGIRGPPEPPESVRDLEIFLGPGPVLVRVGPGFLRLSRSWSELVRKF